MHRTATRRKPRKSPKQARAKETVDAIVTAAARILEQDGYERTNVNRVAERAGVSVGSLYQYFPTKEALVVEVARRLSQQMVDVFQDGLAETAHLEMRETIRAVVARAVRAFRVNPRLRAVVLEELPQHLFDTSDFDATVAVAITGYLRFHSARIRPTNLDLAVAILMSSVEAGAKATALRKEPEDEVVDELSELACRYLMR